MEKYKFRCNEKVRLVRGFYRGLEGRITDVKNRWFRSPLYRMHSSDEGSIKNIPEEFLESIDPKTMHAQFNAKLEKLINE